MTATLTYEAALQALRDLDAPAALIDEFTELFEVYGEEQENVEIALIRVCCRHRWTRIFEADGRTRTIRPRLLPPDSADNRPDHRSTTPGEEQSYRRGYDQGFAQALEFVRSNGIAAAERESERINRWRCRSIQFMGSPPGAEEPLAYDLPGTGAVKD